MSRREIILRLGQLTGRASVIDGDTIEIRDQRICLNGVGAPESWQRCDDAAGKRYRCGRDAAFALDEFLAGSRPTACEPVDRDRWRRVIAVCHPANGADVGAWLVESVHAIDGAKYSRAAYPSPRAQSFQEVVDAEIEPRSRRDDD